MLLLWKIFKLTQIIICRIKNVIFFAYNKITYFFVALSFNLHDSKIKGKGSKKSQILKERIVQ